MATQNNSVMHTTYVEDRIIRTYLCLLADVSELSQVPLGTPDDIGYDWVLIEGPKLDKALLQFLEYGGSTPIFPEWLVPLWDRFRDTGHGDYLGWLRQCLLFCYKIETEPTNEQLKKAQAEFEETEDCIEAFDRYFSDLGQDDIRHSARQIVGSCIYKIDWRSITPAHGPGAVYPPVKPWLKGDFRTIYASIEQHYPYADYLCGIPSFWKDAIWEAQERIASVDKISCRLVAVPKDSRGPRLICVHPAEAIWIQQGCRAVLEQAITSPSFLGSRSIRFSDQTVNGALALASSRNRGYCTLDLKEASDRISCSLVKFLFGDYAYEKISCSRAETVRLLDDRVITLRKWAPMGNCLTFPVQSLIFYSLVRAGIRNRYGIDCTDVYVFGDDLIFPSLFYDGVLNALTRMGMVPNMSKTFRHGLFRESCGVDAYLGIDITPHRLRRYEPSSASGAMSLCTLAKALRTDGYHRTAHVLYRAVEDSWGQLPLSNNPEVQGLARYETCSLGTLMRYERSLRFNRERHCWETSVILIEGTNIRPPIDAWWHLQESLLGISHSEIAKTGERGLEYSVPHRARSKRGYTEALSPRLGTTTL